MPLASLLDAAAQLSHCCHSLHARSQWSTEFMDSATNKTFATQRTERLPTGVGRIGDVVFEVLQHDVFGNGSVGG